MIEILSMPRRPTTTDVTATKSLREGLPINSLPGWEHIPLNCKLPMLKCPGNTVIFSKNKIGESFRHFKHEFDPCGRDSFPEYNPLHDSNLKTFYSNERNLKRLRQNGEITQDNDVICNLKGFNAYRLQLHKSQLYYVLQELSRREAEQHDRMLISNAEAVTSRDHRNLAARQQSYGEIRRRRLRLAEERRQRFQRHLDHTEEKFRRIEVADDMQKAFLDRKKILGQLNIERHQEDKIDQLRMQLIKVKKLFHFKEERFARNMRNLAERFAKRQLERQAISWQKRLDERTAQQSRKAELVEELIEQRKNYIEHHRSTYQAHWAKIQDEIKQRAKQMKRKKRCRRRSKKKKSALADDDEACTCNDYQEIFDKMLEPELCKALNAAIEMDTQVRAPFTAGDPTYKAAQFIMQHIVGKYDKDLTTDRLTCKSLSERLGLFLEEAKKFVMFRATQIISSAQEIIDEGGTARLNKNASITSRVSFNNFSNTIGMSSYEIHPFADVRQVTARKPTPAGSFASIVVDSQESLMRKLKADHLTRNDMVFIEHYVIRLKREIIVGMGRRVFAAIRCHFQDRIMDVRKEILCLDREFVVRQMTNAILGYVRNPLNFDSAVKLGINVLSTEIINSLQKHLLRPKRDPRGIVSARPCTQYADQTKLCLHCH